MPRKLFHQKYFGIFICIFGNGPLYVKAILYLKNRRRLQIFRYPYVYTSRFRV